VPKPILLRLRQCPASAPDPAGFDRRDLQRKETVLFVVDGLLVEAAGYKTRLDATADSLDERLQSPRWWPTRPSEHKDSRSITVVYAVDENSVYMRI
jgi:hypothetical protein